MVAEKFLKMDETEIFSSQRVGEIVAHQILLISPTLSKKIPRVEKAALSPDW